MSIGLLIVVAAAPTLGSWTTERKLRNATDAILEVAAKARLEAKRQGKLFYINFDKGQLQINGSKQGLFARDMKLLIKNNANEWELARGKSWAFYPDGLVEPIALRLEHGSAWIEIEFDILTGIVAKERFSL